MEAALFESKTAFILGAGASAELKFPTGIALMQHIKRKLSLDRNQTFLSDQEIHSALLTHVNQTRPDSPSQYSLSDYLEAAEQISLAMPLSVSIDTYMDDHRTDPRIELCGRLAIVKSILEAEHNSKHEFSLTCHRGSFLG